MTELSTIGASMSDPRVTMTVMGYPSPRGDFWNELVDRDQCAERDGLNGRCQLVVGHNGQHVLQTKVWASPSRYHYGR